MALGEAVQGSVRPAQSITWTDADGTPIDLTGATIAGTMRSIANNVTAVITGDLTVTDGAAGRFTWQYSAADVSIAGTYEAQFTATYPSGPTPARTRRERFEILPSN